MKSFGKFKQKMRHFDYSISTNKLTLPIGGQYHYVAKVAYLYEATESGEKLVNAQLGESWGTTEQEAKEKMEEKLKKWISENQS